MATYVLVHGGDQGDNQVWQGVAKFLELGKHHIHYPAMRPSAVGASLTDNINEICDLIVKQDLSRVILVGHSYGAMVITGVAARLSTRIVSLVYVDSTFPQSGKSLYDMIAAAGCNYEDYNLAPNVACSEKLNFDEQLIRIKPKIYVHCLASDFLKITQPTYEKIVNTAAEDNWHYFSLDASHLCMLDLPQEVAMILHGAQLLSRQS